MKSDTLQHLQCPYCHHSFAWQTQLQMNKDSVEFGSVVCQCEEFPVIRGILYLHRENTKKLLSLVREKQFHKATMEALIGQAAFLQRNIIKRVLPKFLLEENFYRTRPLTSLKPWLQLFMTSQEAHYYAHRQREKESLFFFLPIGLTQKKKKATWVNYASGLHTYHSWIPKNFSTIISVEYSFLLTFFSKIYFDDPRTLYVCGDITSGIYTAQPADVITVMDAFLAIARQRQLVETVTSSHALKKNGTLFISTIPEHAYLENPHYIYPIHHNLLQTFFPSEPLFMNDSQLLKQLNNKTLDIRKIKNLEKTFRYSLLWPQPKTDTISLHIPEELLENAQQSWEKAEKTWENAIY